MVVLTTSIAVYDTVSKKGGTKIKRWGFTTVKDGVWYGGLTTSIAVYDTVSFAVQDGLNFQLNLKAT